MPSVYIFGLDIPCWSRVVGCEGAGDVAGAPSTEDPLAGVASGAGSNCDMVELEADEDPLGMAAEDLPELTEIRSGEDAGDSELELDAVSVRG